MIMFWNSTTKVSKYLQLRSSISALSDCAWVVIGGAGNLSSDSATLIHVVRPALNIDLSKIKWSITEPVVDTTETWVINSDIPLNSGLTFSATANFTSNEEKFTEFSISYN